MSPVLGVRCARPRRARCREAPRRSAEHEPARMIARAKSNISPDSGGFGYDLQHDELEGFPGVYASRVLWGPAIDGSARELLAQAEQVDEEGGADNAKEFLRYTLSAGTDAGVGGIQGRRGPRLQQAPDAASARRHWCPDRQAGHERRLGMEPTEDAKRPRRCRRYRTRSSGTFGTFGGLQEDSWLTISQVTRRRRARSVAVTPW